jgi:hypothetical protein
MIGLHNWNSIHSEVHADPEEIALWSTNWGWRNSFCEVVVEAEEFVVVKY